MIEHDPNGRLPSELGCKLDGNKNRLGLVLLDFSSALWEVGRAGTYGADKYSDGNWLSVPDGVNRYTDAMLRHLLLESNNVIDDKSGLSHAAHVAWNALARLELMIRSMNDE